MHRALQISEILLNIFGHCRLPTAETPGSDLPAVARTCRTFKEPALDVLWSELDDPSPLAQCLPEASRQTFLLGNKCLSFSRPLTRDEHCTLRSYTRRILSMSDEERTLDWKSVNMFSSSPISEPLFPNLRHLCVGQPVGIKELLSMPFPYLFSLQVAFSDMKDLRILQDSLDSISKFSPNIKRLFIGLYCGDITFSKFFSRYTLQWKNLQIMDCGDITLDADAFAHLSRMPALTHLTFTLGNTLPDQISRSNPSLCFSNLQGLVLYSDLLDTVSRLLSSTRLPVLTGFAIYCGSHPSKQDISAFWASLRTSVVGGTIERLWLMQTTDLYCHDGPRPVLCFEDLQPCMEFRNLRRMRLNISWDVDLVDIRLLTLASAWPHLEHLMINETWGWGRPGGITPDGLLQLLRICPSLSSIAIALDTRGYAELTPSSATRDLALPPNFCMDVVDSFIEAEAVPAVAAVFGGFTPSAVFSCRAGYGTEEDRLYASRWRSVFSLVDEIVRRPT